MLYNTFEQFQITSSFSINFFCFDFSISNLALINLLVLLFFGTGTLVLFMNIGDLINRPPIRPRNEGAPLLPELLEGDPAPRPLQPRPVQLPNRGPEPPAAPAP